MATTADDKKTKKAPAAKKAAPAPAKTDKKTAIAAQQQHGKDTGSAPVQISILTNRINALTDHLKTHAKDKSSRRGLLGLVGRRRRLLRYLQMNDAKAYKTVVKDLGLRA